MKKYKCVMLVDDSEMDRFVGKAVLESSQITEQVILGKNGIDGLNMLVEYFSRNRSLPELILVDLEMPMMNGFELIEELMKYSAYSNENCRIIVLTASLSDESQGEKIRSYGVNNILEKPLDKRELLKVINE
jgi:CheY-like chemotaxis protein